MNSLVLFTIIFSAFIIHLTIQVPEPITRVVIDVDPGSDDAFALNALLYAEKKGRVQVDAIVCSAGNTDVKNTCKNVVRLLELFKRTDIPVYSGAFKPIIPLPENRTNQFYFGKDGFGDLTHETEPDLSIIQDVPAAIGIHRLVSNNPKQITMVCLGPLTTTALTMLVYEDFAPNLKQIWIMGGNYEENTTDEPEFNFSSDPESADVVLRNAAFPVILLTWETCLLPGITLDWRFNTLGKQRTPFMDLLNAVDHKVFGNETLDSIWTPCDVYTAIVVVYPETILQKMSKAASVELWDKKSRGKLVFQNVDKNKINVTILKKLDVEAVKNILLATGSYLV